jgi:hypothetical protein
MAKTKREPDMVREIREAVRESGRSLGELSRATGVGTDRLSRFMRGERTLTLPAAAALCEALGLGLSPRRPAPKRPKK